MYVSNVSKNTSWNLHGRPSFLYWRKIFCKQQYILLTHSLYTKTSKAQQKIKEKNKIELKNVKHKLDAIIFRKLTEWRKVTCKLIMTALVLQQNICNISKDNNITCIKDQKCKRKHIGKLWIICIMKFYKEIKHNKCYHHMPALNMDQISEVHKIYV